MPRSNSIRTLFVGVHLGGAPSFDIRADEDSTATPIDCRFTGQGTGSADRDFLLEVLQKIELAFANSTAVSLCVQGVEIKRDSECP